MTDYDDFRMYYGGASGSAQKVLREIGEPHVLMNALTEKNEPWPGIDELFVDSGGYSMMAGGDTDYTWSAAEYVDYVARTDADRFVLRDYPCEPHLLDDVDRTVADHQRMTLDQHIRTAEAALDRGIDAEPVAVVQGWEIDEYLDHVEQLRDHDLLTPTVGVGSICRRGAADQIRDILAAVDNALPDDVGIHAFGVKQDVLEHAETRRIIDSADTAAWYFRNCERKRDDEPAWRSVARDYVQYTQKLDALTTDP